MTQIANSEIPEIMGSHSLLPIHKKGYVFRVAAQAATFVVCRAWHDSNW